MSRSLGSFFSRLIDPITRCRADFWSPLLFVWRQFWRFIYFVEKLQLYFFSFNTWRWRHIDYSLFFFSAYWLIQQFTSWKKAISHLAMADRYSGLRSKVPGIQPNRSIPRNVWSPQQCWTYRILIRRHASRQMPRYFASLTKNCFKPDCWCGRWFSQNLPFWHWKWVEIFLPCIKFVIVELNEKFFSFVTFRLLQKIDRFFCLRCRTWVGANGSWSSSTSTISRKFGKFASCANLLHCSTAWSKCCLPKTSVPT